MRANLLSVDGKKLKEIEIPKFFGNKVRADLIQRILEVKKVKQPYAPSSLGGNNYSASGVLNHRRHVWKSQYGRGISRVPRKIMTRKGSQFSWVGATVPNTRGGRRAHPPKAISMMEKGKVNKKELVQAILSAIAATASAKWVLKRYETLFNRDKKKMPEFPIIVESKLTNLKTKEILVILKKVLGEEMFEVSIQKKKVRSGKGTLRGRRYKKNLGLLIVIGNDEKLKSNGIDVSKVKTLGIEDLAKGVPGRLTVYTEKAIKDLGEKYK